MIHKTMRILNIAAAAMLLLGVPCDWVDAQFAPGSPPTDAQCQEHADSMVANPAWEVNFGLLGRCGAKGGIVLARALRAARTSTDTVYLASLAGLLLNIRDGSVFHAAALVAKDHSASAAARTTALVTLLGQVTPGLAFPFEQTVGQLATVPQSSCDLSGTTDATTNVGSPLPLHSTRRFAAVADSVAVDPGASLALRSLARCVRLATLADVPAQYIPGTVKLTFTCPNKFTVHNAGQAYVSLTWDVQGITGARDYRYDGNW